MKFEVRAMNSRLLALILTLLFASASAFGDEADESHGAEHVGHSDTDHEEHEGQHGEDENGGQGHGGDHSSRLSDENIPLQIEGFPQRPKPIIELGEPFLGTGTLDPGFRLPAFRVPPASS